MPGKFENKVTKVKDFEVELNFWNWEKVKVN